VTEAAVAVLAAEASRRRLTVRQAAVVELLVDAAADEARAEGYEGLTVRNVARRAGVAPATAYTYFASKDHLLAEVLWRRLQALPVPDESGSAGTDGGTGADDAVGADNAARRADRVIAELRALGLFMADDPTLASACTTALLGSGPEVRALRVLFGTALHDRLAHALGDGADAAVLRSLDLAYSGAMLWAGMGHIRFEDVPDALADAARLVLGGPL
jgi:AcrR family transcriptional regulator